MYIKKTETNLSFNGKYKQAFANVYTTNIIHSEILKMKNKDIITEDDLTLVKLAYKFKFLTAEFLPLVVFVDPKINIKERLEFLVKNRILNKFILSEEKEVKKFPADALVFYTLDAGGKTLLSKFSRHMNKMANWNVAETYMGAENIGKSITNLKFYNQLCATCGEMIEDFIVFPQYRLKEMLLIPSFMFYLQKDGKRKYYIGEIVTKVEAPVDFKAKAINIESILMTNAWRKYFSDIEEHPTLLLLCETEDVAIDAAKTIATTTSIERYRLCTFDSIKGELSDPGAFFKFEKEINLLSPVKMTSFGKSKPPAKKKAKKSSK